MVSRAKIIQIHEELSRHLESLGENWKPRHDRILGVPKPLPDEIFSSWCWRTSLKTGLSLKALLAQYGITVPSFWVDTGRVKIDVLRISSITMVEPEHILKLMFSSKSVIGETEFSCLTTEPLARRPIYRYCLDCLKSDQVPYLRKRWRLAHIHLCDIHKNVLRDHCPSCKARLDVSQKTCKPSTLLFCNECGANLSDSSAVELPQSLYFRLSAYQTDLDFLINPALWPYQGPGETSDKDILGGMVRRAGITIELNEESNVLKLFSMLMEMHGRTFHEEIWFLGCCEGIRQRSSSLTAVNASMGLEIKAVGLDMRRVLGKRNAELIGEYLSKCHDLTYGIWLRTFLYSLTRYESRQKKLGEYLVEANQWVKSFGRSYSRTNDAI
jgi:hypothetical protein